MNKLKKLLKPFLLILGITCACLAFAGCGGDKPEQIDANWDHTAGSWKETDGVYFGLVSADDAPEGEIIAENVKADLTMQIGKKYYYIIDFILQAANNNSGWEQLKVSVKLNAETALSADLEETSSSFFTNEVNGDEREIAVTYTVPDYAEVQIKKRIVLGLSAKLGGEVGAKVSFTSGVELAGLPATATDNLTVNYTQGLKYEINNSGYTVYSGEATDKDVIIPYVKDGKYITAIGEEAFWHYDLVNISIPDSVTSICEGALSGNKLQYNKYDNALYLGNENNKYIVLMEAINNEITSCEINSNTKVIYGATGEFTFGKHTSNHGYAFNGCSSLTDITIPESVISIGYGAFQFSGITNITIPDSVTSIGDCAFCACSSLTSIIIPDGVTSIGGWAFAGCSSLTSITIGNGVTSIGECMFEGCSNLTDIAIPDSVTSIGDFAFGWCSSLTSITISDHVTSIGNSAFYECGNLTDITFKGTKEQWYAINKEDGWDYYTDDYTVHCTDGDLSKWGSEE